jgi:CRISPR-associated protein Cst2
MKIYSLSIVGVLDLNLHSLNNEGTEGNFMQTRQVQIIDKEGRLQSVNAISGDMFKHIQAKHMYNLAKSEGLALCDPCKEFDANRIVADIEWAKLFSKETSDTDVLNAALQRCVLDDVEGILITSEVGKKRSIGRKSVLEFGWIVGRPEYTITDSFFHVKFDKKEKGKGAGDETGANTGQNIFHRPASSGQYAVVLNVDLERVGLNDISLQFALAEEERKKRIKALLKSVLFTFLQPKGAMRNTQNPHVTNFSGLITFTSNNIPAPMISPLNLDYKKEIERIAATLNRLEEDSTKLFKFESLAEFSELMLELTEKIEPIA